MPDIVPHLRMDRALTVLEAGRPIADTGLATHAARSGERSSALRSPIQGRPKGLYGYTEADSRQKILPHSVLLCIETNRRPWHEYGKRPSGSLPSTWPAQGHPVLPPYGSGLGRERAVFPRYYRSRPSPSPGPGKSASEWQLHKRAGRLRSGYAQPFVRSHATLVIVRIICGGQLEGPRPLNVGGART